MSEMNITIQAGSKKRLLTGGKYCPANILITAEGGGATNPNVTVKPWLLAEGVIAVDAEGNQIVGTAKFATTAKLGEAVIGTMLLGG